MLRTLIALTLASLGACQLQSCNSTDYSCIEERTLAVQAASEIPNYVTYPIQDDAFYATPANFSSPKPGQILKIEWETDISEYSVPPGQALSRIMYASTDDRGNVVPATAAILWPFSPKSFNGSQKYPLVAWAHGTSGIVRQCAITNQRNLQYNFRSVFTLATAGYAVVMTDYVGLGSDNFFNYLAYKLHADDVVYSALAAQAAFPELSREWVSFGHSEGGGVAWAIGERQAVDPIPGFLGTIAAAPPPEQINTEREASASVFTAFMTLTIANLYGLDLSAIFNPVPLQVIRLIQSIGGCNSASFAAFAGFTAEDIYSNTSWTMTEEVAQYVRDYSVGGRALGGPMLILQGTADTVVTPASAQAGFNSTCAVLGNNGTSIEYVAIEGQGHNPSVYASQRVWLDWIEDRFSHKPTPRGCSSRSVGSSRENVQLPERFSVVYSG